MSVLAVVLSVSVPAFANIFSEAKIYIPFDFYLEEELLPAGNYTFNLGQVTDSSIVVRSADGKAIRLLMAKFESGKNLRDACLKFGHYGNRYVLSSIIIRGNKANLKSSSAKMEQLIEAENERKSYDLAHKNR
jgi:hypothetical protein